MNRFNRNSGNKTSRRRSDRFNRRDSRRPSFEKRKMHEVVCDKCGQSCEVPFKPTEGKPVYCRDCFKKEESPRQESRSGFRRPMQESGNKETEFQQINAKLDKILEILNDL